MITSLPNIKIRVHVIDNSNNEIRGGGVKRDVGMQGCESINQLCPALLCSQGHATIAMCYKLDDNISALLP